MCCAAAWIDLLNSHKRILRVSGVNRCCRFQHRIMLLWIIEITLVVNKFHQSSPLGMCSKRHTDGSQTLLTQLHFLPVWIVKSSANSIQGPWVKRDKHVDHLHGHNHKGCNSKRSHGQCCRNRRHDHSQNVARVVILRDESLEWYLLSQNASVALRTDEPSLEASAP